MASHPRRLRCLIAVGAAAAALVAMACNDGPSAPAGFLITGTVTNAQGQPLHAAVNVRKDGQLVFAGNTNPTTGAYSADGVPAGTVEVSAAASGYRSTTKIVECPPQAEVDLQLPEGRPDPREAMGP